MNLVQRSATAESAKDAAGEASVVLRSKKTGPRAGSTAYSDFLTKLSGSASASHQLAVEEEDSDEEGLLAEARAERARQNALDVRRSWVERMEADEDAPDKPPAAAQPPAALQPPPAAASSKGRRKGGELALPAFIPAASFDGARPGFKFQTGEKGTGYYPDESREGAAGACIDVSDFSGGAMSGAGGAAERAPAFVGSLADAEALWAAAPVFGGETTASESAASGGIVLDVTDGNSPEPPRPHRASPASPGAPAPTSAGGLLAPSPPAAPPDKRPAGGRRTPSSSPPKAPSSSPTAAASTVAAASTAASAAPTASPSRLAPATALSAAPIAAAMQTPVSPSRPSPPVSPSRPPPAASLLAKARPKEAKSPTSVGAAVGQQVAPAKVEFGSMIVEREEESSEEEEEEEESVSVEVPSPPRGTSTGLGGGGAGSRLGWSRKDDDSDGEIEYG